MKSKKKDDSPNIKKILIFSANPKDTTKLRLDEEVREIEDRLRRSTHRDQFTIQTKWAVRIRDLRQTMLDEKPHIVHFCGHGEEHGLLLEDENGNAIPVNPQALAEFFEFFKDTVECVLLNACYSEKQANAINKHIDYVIGMSQSITDKAALEFSIGFYDLIGAGKSIEEAFQFGRNAIGLYNIPEELTPKLKRKIDSVPRILVSYPLSTPCKDFVEWIKEKVEENSFNFVKPPDRMESLKQFKEFAQNIEGIIALYIPFDKGTKMTMSKGKTETIKNVTSAWVHNFLGAIVAQNDPPIPVIAIPAKDVDFEGIARLDECRCPVPYPWEAEKEEQENALARIENEHLLPFFEKVRNATRLISTKSTVVFVDIMGSPPDVEHGKQLLRSIVTDKRYSLYLQQAIDTEKGGYFVFGMDYNGANVLQFAQELTEALVGSAYKVRIVIDCGKTYRSTSITNWRLSMLTGRPINRCYQISEHVEANKIIVTEKFYWFVEDENFHGRFSDPENVPIKEEKELPVRHYVYTI